jgi:chromosome segregation ATPase
MAVALDENTVSITDTRHFLEWLDEQRQLDHERLVLVVQTVDQLRKDLREQGTAITHAETMSMSRSTTESRTNEGLVVSLADQITRLDRVVTEHIATQTRTSQAENAMQERERRQLAELTQQVEGFNRTLSVSTGRVSALSEEIRHERDSRAPFTQAIDELQRVQTTVSTRVGSMEQMVRRLSGTLSVAENSDEKQRTDLARVDNMIKLVDLRVTRELSEIQRVVDEWKTRIEEQVKPVDGLTRLVGQLADQREHLQGRSLTIGETVDRIGRDLSALDAQTKSDRTAIQRGAEAIEAVSRRLEATGGSIWQLGERIAGLVQELEVMRSDIRTAYEQIESVSGRADSTDEFQRRIEATELVFAHDLRALRTDARDWVDGVESRFDGEITALVAQAEARYRTSVEHLRRSAVELNQQVRELEAGLT